jgi:hypothetical protein
MRLYRYNSEELKYKRISFMKLFLLFLGVLSLSSFSVMSIVETYTIKVPVIVRVDEMPLTEINLRTEIQRLQIRFEDVVVKQFYLESAGGTSSIAVENNNLFGMKVARLRPTTAMGENRNHAYYKSWQDCVTDYALWQTQNAKNIRDTNEYYLLLDAIYAEVPDYVERLKTIK